jgi:hypothetical protein
MQVTTLNPIIMPDDRHKLQLHPGQPELLRPAQNSKQDVATHCTVHVAVLLFRHQPTHRFCFHLA